MRRWLAGITTIMLLLAACGSPGQSLSGDVSSASAEPPAESAEERVAHFYNINSLTGPAAPFGVPTINGVNLRAEQINEAGGFEDDCGNAYTVKITTRDMANEREQAVALLREAAADPSVLGNIGPTSSTGYVPMVPVAGELGIPTISIGAGATIEEWNDYAFRINVVPSLATPIMMQKLEDEFDIGRLAIIYDQAQDGNRTDAELIRDLDDDVGYEVVAFEAFRTGDPDMRSQLTTIAAADPDWIAYNAPGEDLARVVNQAFELGLGDLPMITGFSQFDNPTVWELTSGKVEGGYSWTSAVDVSTDSAEVQAFIDAYDAAFDDDPTIYSLNGSDAVDLYVDAVKRSCTATDREAFMEALRATEGLEGIATVVTFGEDTGENLTPAVKVTRTVGPAQTEEVE